jgi:hypothetical protein
MEMMTTLTSLADRVACGSGISESEAQLVLDARDLIAIGAMADDVRRRLHGARTTFLRVFETHVESPPAALPPGVQAGELRIVGRPASVDAAVNATTLAAALARTTPVSGFSLVHLLSLVSAGESLGSLAARLRDAGLESLAELPIDLVQDAASVVAQVRDAGLRLDRITVDTLRADDRIALVARVRDLQTSIGGFRTFAPLPRNVPVSAPTTGYDDVKQIAIARMLAANVPSIQVDWIQYGPKLAQVALTTGADDVDGIAAADPGVLGTRRSPLEEIRGNIRAAGLEPAERNGRWEDVMGNGKWGMGNGTTERPC